MRAIAIAVFDYLIGFAALAVFAYLAFARGHGTDEGFVNAFKVGSLVAVVELALLLARQAPANRLILGANLWLMAGGLAAFAEQWWWLKLYQQFGEASLFVAMLCVGVATTVFTPSGFIAKLGPAAAVRRASWVLLAAVGCALWVAVWFRGDVKFAAVLPVVALSWLNRLLRHRLPA
jgi:predicted permease